MIRILKSPSRLAVVFIMVLLMATVGAAPALGDTNQRVTGQEPVGAAVAEVVLASLPVQAGDLLPAGGTSAGEQAPVAPLPVTPTQVTAAPGLEPSPPTSPEVGSGENRTGQVPPVPVSPPASPEPPRLVPLAAGPVVPQPEASPSQPPSQLLASYSTSLLGSPANRTHNIRLAASKLSGKVLQPGEVFSFNRVVGPRTEKTGFRKAMIIANRRFIPGVGGGVCQVASTLYNATLNASMRILERYPHSLPVKYVPRGRDATVNYGTADFKFRNTKPFPVQIIANVTGRQLTISLVARPKTGGKGEGGSG